MSDSEEEHVPKKARSDDKENKKPIRQDKKVLSCKKIAKSHRPVDAEAYLQKWEKMEPSTEMDLDEGAAQCAAFLHSSLDTRNKYALELQNKVSALH